MRACTFEFEVADLPAAEFYTFEVGDRGELTYSPEEMAEMDWQVSFSLGD